MSGSNGGLAAGLGLHLIGSVVLAINATSLSRFAVIDWIFRIMSRDYILVKMLALVIAAGFLVCYWWSLQLGKWVVRNPLEDRDHDDEDS